MSSSVGARHQRQNIRRSALSRARGEIAVGHRPYHVFTELTTTCNLKCIMCPRTAATDSLEGLDMPFEVLQRLEESVFPDAALVELNGVGDSLLMKRWDAVLDLVERHAMIPLLTTNGLVLDERTIEVFAQKDGILRVSIDGATKATYERIRVLGDFDRLRRRLALLRDVRARFPRSRMRAEFSFVAMRQNVRELLALVDLAAEFGFDTILVQNMVAVKPEHQAWSLVHTPVYANYLFCKAKLAAERRDIHLYLPPLFETPGVGRLRELLAALPPRRLNTDVILQKHLAPGAVLCPEPWMTMNVQRDGTVTPCCVSPQVMGNVRQQSADAIWNGPEYRQLRAELSTQAPLRNEHCRNCHFLLGNRRAALFKEDAAARDRSVDRLRREVDAKERHIQNLEALLREHYIEL